MSSACAVRIRHAGISKKICVYPGMPKEEIKTVLAAAFSISEHIVGLYDPSEDTFYPIAMLARAPFYVSS